jgi:predicted O-methyltransferase YrrM
MADLNKFRSGLARVLFSSYGDTQFEAIRAYCGGMSGTKTAKVLNFATSCLDKDEMYVEIGVFTGYTMICAGLGNPGRIIGIDNLSQFGNHVDFVTENFNRFSHPLYQFINEDFRKVAFPPEHQKRAGVLYVDGKHDYQEVVDTFAWAESGILSDKSIIVLDDVAVDGVSDAIDEQVANHKEYKRVFHLKPYFDESNGAWSHDLATGLGFTVLTRERESGQ